MNAPSPRRNASGFTLIELVISAALMTMILASAYLCLSSGLSSQKLVDSRIDAFQNARVAMALLSADLRCACPLSQQFQFVGMHRMLEDVQADNLDFATHNYTPRRPGEGDICEVSYFMEKDRKSGQYTLWRRRDSTPDAEPLTGGSREEIARGLRALKLEYYDGFDWYEDWGDTDSRGQAQSNSALSRPNSAGLPEAVRVTLWFEADTKPRKSASQDESTPEPPLVFQTVVRLNLAASRAASGTSDNNGSTGQPSQTPPEGGRQ